MTDTLKPCPCGKTPTVINIYDADQGGKWAWCVPDCCNEWHIEFRTHYHAIDSKACMILAAEAWNDAPRTLPPEIQELIIAIENRMQMWTRETYIRLEKALNAVKKMEGSDGRNIP